ncbi:longitudinals lacking protein, isoforms J/P/Q/S/Z-like [Macrosteles quadrilineatus]|uniref:longitudinals lacking protein, isoforms J/P/Q/S/Z-like n=1 Tax=Macrosteles quadrilineatus TaxID=74068 RepID=UPI0023E23F59|nr:longitudinals lacking protein, isoforms J/P/Q/S/Z-like [Macrosteles quadrilineatus]
MQQSSFPVVPPVQLQNTSAADALQASADSTSHGDYFQQINYHQCPQCRRSYRTVQGVQQHLRLECGKSPSKCCTLCSYKTYYTSHLKRHLVTKHWDYVVTDPGHLKL